MEGNTDQKTEKTAEVQPIPGTDTPNPINSGETKPNPNPDAFGNSVVDENGRYRHELAKGVRRRYEAKLLILGDGNEGKTCVSRSLRDLPFLPQKPTGGVEIAQWRFRHPDDIQDESKTITLNIWDFEGQEISHQTHQFFLTSQSLYLLVFRCREQFRMERLDYWMQTIRARAPKAKVAIVISECETMNPYLPQDKIKANYENLLAKEWLFQIGCESGLNIENLKAFLKRWAADLDFMGSEWPESYANAEALIEVEAKKGTSHIRQDTLHAIFANATIDQASYQDAAAAMARLGIITHFPECAHLTDFVVLNPQWLTKAISMVMNDRKLLEDKGEIVLKRMEEIWSNSGYRGAFTMFHVSMKEVELCYDLEDDYRSCLVPLHFGYLPPEIPWTNVDGIKKRRMEYNLNIPPPLGIMSRFIVKTHYMIVKTSAQPKGVYWHNGVFLRSGEGSSCSEALCEFVPDERLLRIKVQAAFPQNLCEQIHGYVKAVFALFPGLKAERFYGCIKRGPGTAGEEPCRGILSENRIYTAISRGRETIDCDFEDHEVDPRLLVSGISSFGGFVEERIRAIVREEGDKPPEWAEPFLHGMRALLDWVQSNGGKLDQLLLGQAALSAEFKQEAELNLHKYLECMSQLLDDHDQTAAPGLILITTKDPSPWNPVGYFQRFYILTPFCECEGNIHACDDGCVEFTKDKEWWQATAPWIARATKVLAAGLQLGFAGMPLTLGPDAAKLIEHEVKFMGELTKHIQLEASKESEDSGAEQVISGDVGKDLRGNDREAAVTRAALARFLEETAPDNYRAKRWGSLSRRRMSDNTYRWLCNKCA